MARIKRYEEDCTVCGLTMAVWAYKTTEIKLYYNLDINYEEVPLCSRSCQALFNLNPLAYDDPN